MSGELPAGWVWAKLGDFAQVRLGRQRSPDRHTGPDMAKYLRAANVTWEGIDTTDVKEMAFTPTEMDVFRLEPGDILLSEASGSASEVGKPAVWRGEIEACCFQNTLIRVRAPAEFVPLLHYHFVNDARNGRFAAASRGVGIHHLGCDALQNWKVAVPPIEEQSRIVAKLEELRAQSRKAREALDAVPALLEKLKQSILAAAFRGDLTTSWRAAHPETEPATALLDRIRAERRRRWEAANPKKKYPEPTPLDLATLPDLPDGWCWARIDEVGDADLGRMRSPDRHHGPKMRKYLRVHNVHEDRIDTSDVMEMDFTDEEFEHYRLQPGDILLNEGQTRELVGRPAMFNGEVEDAAFTNSLIRYRAIGGVTQEFALFVFLYYLHSGRFTQIAQITTNIAHLGALRFRAVEFPLPPLEEQEQICKHIRALRSHISSVKAATAQMKRELQSMDQSLLAKAFRGELVPQDPNDEPASALFARLATTPTRRARAPR